MSRSKKKHPWVCDRNPWQKNYANRKLRRISKTHELADGKAYRKNYCSWSICDWKWQIAPEDIAENRRSLKK